MSVSKSEHTVPESKSESKSESMSGSAGDPQSKSYSISIGTVAQNHSLCPGHCPSPYQGPQEILKPSQSVYQSFKVTLRMIMGISLSERKVLV